MNEQKPGPLLTVEEFNEYKRQTLYGRFVMETTEWVQVLNAAYAEKFAAWLEARATLALSWKTLHAPYQWEVLHDAAEDVRP